MSLFTDLLANPFAERDYLVTVYPTAYIYGSISAEPNGIFRSTRPLFKGLEPGDVFAMSLFSNGGNNGNATIVTADRDGKRIVVSGLTTVTEAAGTRKMIGDIARYFSVSGLTTKPTDTPANQHYDPRVENALTFTRTLAGGDGAENGRLGGISLPGYGKIRITNDDGGLDYLRKWGFAGKRIRVEMGAPGFTRADYGVLFDGLTKSHALTDDWLDIAITDFQDLFDNTFWSPVYLGTGNQEGGIDLLGTLRPICVGYCRNIRPRPLGVWNGLFVYQFHDGPVKTYDATFHNVYDAGVPLVRQSTFINLVPGEWYLDTTFGLIILGGSPEGEITADVIGADPGGSPTLGSDVASLIKFLAKTRLVVDSNLSVTSTTIGTGSKTITVPATMRFFVGTMALIAKRDDPEAYWMYGTVTAYSNGSLTVNVTRTAGTGTYADWGVNRIGFDDSEIDLASFASLTSKNGSRVGYYIDNEETAETVFDELITTVGGFLGFTRAGLFQVGRIELPSGDPVLSLDGYETLELHREDPRPPTWAMTMAYQRNWNVLRGNDLAPAIRENVVTNGTFNSASGWTTGTGYSIGAGVLTAVAGSASDTSRAIVPTPNVTYTLKIDVTRTAGTAQMRIGTSSIAGNNVGAAISASGTYEFSWTAPASVAGFNIYINKDSAFAGSFDNLTLVVTMAQFFQNEWRFTAPKADGEVRAVYGPSALDETIYTLFDEKTAADTERDRQAAIFKLFADSFVAAAKTQPFAIDVGEVAGLSDPSRFDLDVEGSFLATSIDEDAGDNRVTISMWGP